MYLRAYAWLAKTWDNTSSLCEDHIRSILKKWVIEQAVGGKQEKSEILAIFHCFKDTIDDLIDSSDDNLDTEPLAIVKQVDMSNNSIPGPRNSISNFKEGNDISNNGS